MKINLVIPCYNEEDSVRNLYNNLNEFGDNDIHFYILDNGSIDGTQVILKDLNQTENIKFLNLPENRGYGYGVHYGLKEISKADYIGWFHGDLQFDIKNLYKIKKIIDEAKVVNGKPIFYKGIRKGRSLLSNTFSLFMGIIATIILRKTFYEINAQPTIFSPNLLDQVESPPYDFSYDTYIYWLAKKNNYKFLRTRVEFPARQFGESKWDFGLISKLKFSYKNIKYILSLIGND